MEQPLDRLEAPDQVCTILCYAILFFKIQINTLPTTGKHDDEVAAGGSEQLRLSDVFEHNGRPLFQRSDPVPCVSGTYYTFLYFATFYLIKNLLNSTLNSIVFYKNVQASI